MTSIKYAGSEWIEQQLPYWKQSKLSELGKKAADFLGEWQRGIYHLSQKELMKADWSNNHYIEISIWCTCLSTYDFDDLTRLVFIAHKMALRVQIEPSTHHHLRIMFHERSSVIGDDGKPYHPTLEGAVNLFNQTYEMKS